MGKEWDVGPGLYLFFYITMYIVQNDVKKQKIKVELS